MSKKTKETTQSGGTKSPRVAKKPSSNHSSNRNAKSLNKDAASGSFELSLAKQAQLGTDSSVRPLWQSINPWNLSPERLLPSSLGGFVRFFIFVIVIAVGSIVHIFLSAQILDAQLRQNELEQEYMAIQRQNAHISWKISQYTSLDQVQQRAFNIGYTSSLGRSYAHSPISDDTLAQIEQTILDELSPQLGNSQAGSQGQSNDRLVDSRQLQSPQAEDEKLGQQAALAANLSVGASASASANRIIESGLLEAVKVINGR